MPAEIVTDGGSSEPLLGPAGSRDATPKARARSPVKTATPGCKGARLPRQGGMPGGGRLVSSNPDLLESVLNEVELWAETETTPSSSNGTRKKGQSRLKERRPSSSIHTVASASAPGAAGGTETPKSSATNAPETKYGQTIEERRRAEIFAKWDRMEGMRTRDQKVITERVYRGKEAREDRFDRLLEAVTGRDNLAYKTAMALRERENHEDKRRQEFHEAWEENVYRPLADQALAHMNPPDRVRLQEKGGSKSVTISLPGDIKRLVSNVSVDPVRKACVDHSQENAFHHVANVVLHGAHSAPHLHNHCLPQPATGGPTVMPRARTRPCLEPTNWGTHEIKGTLFGHFARVCEFGPGFKRTMRGGTDVHVPDSSDMVLSAGSRHSREHGHGDVGILRGDTAARGESTNFKAPHGPSCGGPMQDHFTFECGARVTDLEFPLGKRIFKEFH